MTAPADLAAAPSYVSGGHQLTRTDIRDELKAFAEVVLERHLADLASRVQKDVRGDVEQLLKEHSAAWAHSPQGSAPLRAAALARPQPQVAWDEELSAKKFLSDSTVSQPNMTKGSNPLAMSIRSKSEGDMVKRSENVVGSLREAVLGQTKDTLSERCLVSELESHDVRELRTMQARVRSVVRNAWFERIASVMIFLNCIFIGVMTDYMARMEQQTVPLECQVIEIAFLVVFAIELFARLFAFRRDFFSPVENPNNRPNPHFYWNIMDCFAIAFQAVEVISTPFSAGLGIMERVSILRIVRLVRLFRIVRLLKVMRFVGDLRMIVYGIWRSMSLFFWAITALLIMNFMCSVYFTDLVLVKKLEGSVTASNVDKHFGSLGSSMISLFMALNGGRNWGDLTDVLSDQMDLSVMCPFLIYMAFNLYAVLNVITGLFLETAMDGARDEREFYVVCNARMVFQAADENGNGTITWPDLKRTLTHKDVRRFFDAVDIEISEAKALFTLLDTEGDGYISSDEFIDGCLRVRGPSKSLDLLVLQREVSQLFENHYRRRQQVPLRPKYKHAASVAMKLPTTGTLKQSSPVRTVPQEEDAVHKQGHCIPTSRARTETSLR